MGRYRKSKSSDMLYVDRKLVANTGNFKSDLCTRLITSTMIERVTLVLIGVHLSEFVR